MAQIKINLGTPPSGQDGDPVRTAFEKTNTMFGELYTAITGVPVSVRSTPLTGLSLASPSTIAAADTVLSALGKLQAQLNGFVKVSSATDTTAGRLLTVGYCGLGAKDNNQYLGSGLDPSDYRAGGTFFAQWNLAGIGLAVGTLTVEACSDAQWLGQTVMVLSSGAIFTRSQDGAARGSFTPWRRTYNDANSFNDPQTSGGLMSSTVVSGWTIEKFANGTAFISGAPAQTPVMPANSITQYAFTIPSLFTSEINTLPTVALIPTVNADAVITSAYMINGTTTCMVHVKNGPSAQTLSLRVRISGRWKA